MQVGSFGGLLFEVSAQRVHTASRVRRENKARYEEHKVLGASPRLEFLSPELQVFNLTIQLSRTHGVRPLESLDLITGYIKGGIAQRLVLGGVNYGHHIIESASEEWRHSDRQGRLINATVTLSFKEYIA